MKYITLLALFSLLIMQSLTQVCNTEACCESQQSPNPSDGNGYQEFNPSCLPNGGLNCVGNTGCQLCYKPTFGSTNIGGRPTCGRFSNLNAVCSNEACCEANQNGNPADGNGFLEYNQNCLPNGGLNCVANTGCQLCYSPVLGSTNIGMRPICNRKIVNIQNYHSGKFLNVNGGSLANGAYIIQWDNPTAPETQWIVTSIALTNLFVFQNVKSGLYINVQGAGTNDGAQIIQWNNPTAPETEWMIIPTTPAGYVIIQNFHSGKDLNVDGASTNDGANIIQWDNPTAPETKWILIPTV